MDKNSKRTEYSFFAASNSYDGFVSYFDTCFSSREFNKIFVLKGGPGTGKSSIMKRVAESFPSNEFHIEEIYCSSDVNSLDGIIIESGKSKCAILDGTAPHQRDAEIPGAVEEIINLGNYWDTSALEKQRERIIELNNKKSIAYEKAYEKLHFSSIFARKALAELSKYFLLDKAEECSDMLCRALYTEGEHRRDIRLISAFGKNGLVRFDTLNKVSKRFYNVSGNEIAAGLFMKILRSNLMKTDTDFYILPSPLDKNICQAIYIPKTQTSVMIGGNSGSEISADAFLSAKYSENFTDDIMEYNQTSEKFLRLSQKDFNRASALHFELEAIYSPTMDFSYFPELENIIINKFKGLLY